MSLLAVYNLVIEVHVTVPFIEGLMRRVALEIASKVLGGTDGWHSVLGGDESLFKVSLPIKIHGVDKHQILSVSCVQEKHVSWKLFVLIQHDDVAYLELRPGLLHGLFLAT